MKSKILIIATLIGFLFSCEKEISETQSERFIKFYGNYMIDEARDVEVLEDGSIAICGIGNLPGVGKRSILVITDEYGNVKAGFPKYFPEGDLNSGANALVVKRGGSGGFLMCGFVEHPVPGERDSVQNDVLMVRISRDGEELWTKSFGTMEDETILHATEGISSGFMLAGNQVRNGKRDIMIIGVDDSGNPDPLKLNYNNPNADNASANFILNAGDRYLCVCTYDKLGNEGTDILILNLDDDLSPNDEILDGEQNEFGRCLVESGNDQYLVLGNRENVTGQSEIVVHRIETSGLLITSSILLATISERDTDLYGERFVKTEDGRIAIFGTCEKDGNRDMFLQFMQSDYQVDDNDRIFYGSDGDQSGIDITRPDGGSLLMLGTNGFDQNSMITLIKTDDFGEL